MKPALVVLTLALAWAAHAQDPAAPVAAKPSLTGQTTRAQPGQWATRLPVTGRCSSTWATA